MAGPERKGWSRGVLGCRGGSKWREEREIGEEKRRKSLDKKMGEKSVRESSRGLRETDWQRLERDRNTTEGRMEGQGHS